MKVELPTLYAKNKNGIWKEWKISVERDKNDVVRLETQYGQLDGKKVMDVQAVLTLKRNQTSLWDQAIAMAQSKWKHKHEREGYQETMQETSLSTTKKIKPMLAKTFEQGGKHLKFPLLTQPKLDGLRCLAQGEDGEVILYSRTGCVFQGFQKIKEELKPYFQQHPRHVVDGELYSEEIPFEELSGYCRRQKEPPNSDHVRFHVFDVAVEGMGFEQRMTLFPKETQHIVLVPTQPASKLEEIHTQLQDHLHDGYEGIMLRNREGLYLNGYRSWDLQKYKLFQEEEFVITGFMEGTGREKGMVIWQCQTKEGKLFHVRPQGTHSTRKELFQEASEYVGEKLTVVFQEYTQDKIPRFPVAKAIRKDY